jgi:hypothetical protein
MQVFTTELQNALSGKAYYAAILLALTLPDVCSALESPNGASTPAGYKTWYEKWLQSQCPTMSADDIYFLRCSVAHQAAFNHPAMKVRKVYFTLPTGLIYDQNEDEHGLQLDLIAFCRRMAEAVDRWYAEKGNSPGVQANIKRMFKFLPNIENAFIKRVKGIG